MAGPEDSTPEEPDERGEGEIPDEYVEDFSAAEEIRAGEHEFLNVQFLAVGVLSMVAVLGVFVSPLSVNQFADLNFASFLSPSMLFALLLVFPPVYTAVISVERFRKESLAGLIVLPMVFAGGMVAVASIIVPLMTVFASYVARSNFNGKNHFWTFYKAGSTAVLVIALVIASLGAYTVAVDDEFRADLKESVTGKTVDTAGEFINASVEGGSDQITRVANNASFAAIVLTEKRVLDAVRESGDFSSGQITLLEDEFVDARNEVPGNISRGLEQIVAEGSGTVTGPVEAGVSSGVDLLFERRAMLVPAVFLTLFSFLLILKIPFGLLGGLIGFLIWRLGGHGG